MESITINLSLLGLMISAIMMVVSMANMNRGKRERDDQRFKENIEMSVKLDNISNGMSEIKKDLQKSLDGYNKNEKRISALETAVAGILQKITKIEEKK